ncbi:unnamed protein product, partial [Mesorhabditis belari]|uniref:Tetratricopeptide repeat protein 1 n=1 Tax=Mesorhabditis belari TaxID=2138241 RepID=A0AAF3FAI4_9BILA
MAIIEEIFDDENTDQVKDAIQKAEVFKNQGNTHFGQGEWAMAKEEYQKGLDYLKEKYADRTNESTDESDEKTETEPESSTSTVPEEISTLRATLLSNMSAAFIKMEQWEPAVHTATMSIKEGVKNEKALERRAFAYSKIDDKLNLALQDYESLSKTFPDRTQYRQKITELKKLVDEQNEKLKQEMMDKLKGFGDFCLRPFGLSTNSFQFTPNETGGYSMSLKQPSENTENT